jgi:hypothetical protein
LCTLKFSKNVIKILYDMKLLLLVALFSCVLGAPLLIHSDGDDSLMAKYTPKPVPVSYNIPLNFSSAGARDQLKAAAMALYNNRDHETYTQGGSRWEGINDGVRPPNAPRYSDCSAAATWVYWTVYGGGADFINGEHWTAGYTGTMIDHGTEISLSAAQPGDLVFYGSSHSSISHVAIFVGDGMVVSHGSDPVRYASAHYRSDLQQVRRYI